MGGGAEPPPQAGMKEAQEKDTDGPAMVGGGVTGCGQKVSATSLCPEDELDGFLLLHYPPSYSPDQQPALNPALGEHPESVCQITVCVNE